jgi:hypothetical protein
MATHGCHLIGRALASLMATTGCHQKGLSMPWPDVAAYFFGGAFLANFAPHFVAGVSGRRFHSPFASPPFRGLSSPEVNIAWGLFNLVVAYALLLHVGEFDVRSWLHVGVGFAGFGVAAVNIARSIGRIQAERRGQSSSAPPTTTD